MTRISKSSWDELDDDDKNAVVDRLRYRKVLGSNEQVAVDPDGEPVTFDHVDVSGIVMGKGSTEKCRRRCSKFAEFMYKRCLEEGGKPKQCLKSAEQDYRDCLEECLNER